MGLIVGKPLHIVRGPGRVNDPLRHMSLELWQLLAAGEQLPTDIHPSFLCSEEGGLRNHTSQVHFQTLQVAQPDNDHRYCFTATGVGLYPRDDLADVTPAIGFFDPSTDQHTKGLLVATAGPIDLADAPTHLARLGQPLARA